MQLTKQQKEDLKSLSEHRGYKVLEALVKEEEYNLLSKFKTASLGDENTAVQLSGAQNKLLGMEYIINIVSSKSQGVVKAPDMK